MADAGAIGPAGAAPTPEGRTAGPHGWDAVAEQAGPEPHEGLS